MNPALKIIFLLITVSAQVLSEPLSFQIDRHGRRIQLDGFLVEWNQETVRKWGISSGSEWFFDAINTPEGLSGYIRSTSTVNCSTFAFAFEQNKMIMTFPDKSQDSNLYKIDSGLYDSLGIVVLEWVIPWNRTELNSQGVYRLKLNGWSSCNDSLPAITITGSKEVSSAILNPWVVLRIILILFLLVVYVVIYIRIRNRTARKGSPHR